MKSREISLSSQFIWVCLVTLFGGLAGAYYGAFVLYPAPGLSEPRLSSVWVVGGNAVLCAIMALVGALFASVGGFAARKLGGYVIAEIVAVLAASLGGSYVGAQLTWAFVGATNWTVLSVIAVLLTSAYFGVTRLIRVKPIQRVSP